MRVRQVNSLKIDSNNLDGDEIAETTLKQKLISIMPFIRSYLSTFP